MAGMITYPRTDGARRIERDLFHLEKMIAEILATKLVTSFDVENILALLIRIGWSDLTLEQKHRLMRLIRQALESLHDLNVYLNPSEAAQAKQAVYQLSLQNDHREAETYDLSEKRGLAPWTLEGAVYRFEVMSSSIENHGYQPKYSDVELQAMVTQKNIGNERFHVRFMETKYLVGKEGAETFLGRCFEGTTGNGAKYWTTTLDQLEDADTNPKLIAGKLGLEYNEKTDYTLIVLDRSVARTLTEIVSVPATFQQIGDFVHQELPKEFSRKTIDAILNSELQAKYAAAWEMAKKSKWIRWDGDIEKFQKYVKYSSIDIHEKKALIKRAKLHALVGNNEYHEGSGVTKNLISESNNKIGTIEFLNFERRQVSLEEHQRIGALKIIKRVL